MRPTHSAVNPSSSDELLQLDVSLSALSWADHCLLLLVVLILPIVAWYRFRKLRVRLHRVRTYINGSMLCLALVGLCMLLWSLKDRPYFELGIRTHWGASCWIAFAYSLFLLAVSFGSERSMLRDEKRREKLLLSARSWGALVPRTKVEFRAFLLFTVVVGISEELLYRGFSTWYLTAFLPTIAAFVAAPILFGFAHIYQGRRGVMHATLLGLILSMLYLVSTTLWVPLVFHVVWNLKAARLAARVLATPEARRST